MPDKNDMQAVIDAAREGVAPLTVDPSVSPLMVLRDGTTLSLEPYLPAPQRKRGEVVVFDPASFNQVVRDNAGAGNPTIYLDRNPDAPSVVAVLNGHGPNGPGWGDFRVRISFRPTPQWAKWKGISGKLLPQTDFAEFIEDNEADIEVPSGAQMLEIATAFQATRTTAFRRAVRLSSGQVQFENVENIEAKVGIGMIEVPETLTLRLAPLQGSPLFAVPATFRYRLEDGKLRLGIKLERVEDLMNRVLEDVIAKIERGANISVIDGVPPSPQAGI
jgi:uncharacterized protein YfdQ (DUF2303 family)